MASTFLQVSELKKLIENDLADSIAVYHFKNIYEVLKKLPDTPKNREINAAALHFSQHFSTFYNAKDLTAEDYVRHLNDVEQSYTKFVGLIKDNPILELLKKPLQALSSIIVGLTFGTFGLAFGGITGFVRGCVESKNPFRVAFESMLAGATISFVAGKRLPDNFFNNAQRAKISSTLKRLNYIHGALNNTVPDSASNKATPLLSDSELEKSVKEKIITHYIDDNEDAEQAFEEFLAANHAIQVCTRKAEFGMRYLQGNLGHHSFIRIAIGKKELLPIEFGPPFKHPPKFVDQAEEVRIVSGELLFNMLVKHEKYRQIQNFGPKYMLNQYMAGEYDCRSYVNQILESVGLKRSKVKRFVSEVDSTIGTYFYKPALTKTCFFSQEELNADAAEVKITHYTRSGYKQFETERASGDTIPKTEKFELQLEYTGFSHSLRQAKIAEYEQAIRLETSDNRPGYQL